MNKIEKLLRKISQKDRGKLLKIVEMLIKASKNSLNAQKIAGTNFYRVRSGKFRIIFHYEKNQVIVDSIKMRSEKTGACMSNF